MVSSGYISFGKSHQTTVVFADSPGVCENTNIVTSTLEDLNDWYSTRVLAQLGTLSYRKYTPPSSEYPQ